MRSAGMVVVFVGVDRLDQLCHLVREEDGVPLQGKLLEGKVVVGVRYAELELEWEFRCRLGYADHLAHRPEKGLCWWERNCSAVEKSVLFALSRLVVS